MVLILRGQTMLQECIDNSTLDERNELVDIIWKRRKKRLDDSLKRVLPVGRQR